jgi:hypothetical protein
MDIWRGGAQQQEPETDVDAHIMVQMRQVTAICAQARGQ